MAAVGSKWSHGGGRAGSCWSGDNPWEVVGVGERECRHDRGGRREKAGTGVDEVGGGGRQVEVGARNGNIFWHCNGVICQRSGGRGGGLGVRPLREDLPPVHHARASAGDGPLRRLVVVELDEGDALVGGRVLVADHMARHYLPVRFEVRLH